VLPVLLLLQSSCNLRMSGRRPSACRLEPVFRLLKEAFKRCFKAVRRGHQFLTHGDQTDEPCRAVVTVGTMVGIACGT
jgi:hypothetical protein